MFHPQKPFMSVRLAHKRANMKTASVDTKDGFTIHTATGTKQECEIYLAEMLKDYPGCHYHTHQMGDIILLSNGDFQIKVRRLTVND